MSITAKALDIIADIGMNAAKEKFILKADEAKVRKKLVDYLTRQQKHNFNCTTAEEIDFEGLAEYIRDNLMSDVEVRLFGTKEERDAARQTIANKAEHYATAKTNLSKERSKQLTFAAVDILRKFFRAKVGRNLLYVATEIEDTVISEMTNQYQETNDKIDDLKNFIQDCNPLSLDKNISLAKRGELGEVEKNLSIFIDSLSATHTLKPYYGYAMDETLQLKSTPLRADALECYPPSTQTYSYCF